MKISRVAGTTNEILQIFVRDSSSTTGAGLAGLVFNTASLTAYYIRNNQSSATVISLVTMSLGTYTSSGFKEIDATNMPGWYQFCPPSGVFTSGGSAAIHLKGATNMAPLPIEVEITAWDNQNATSGGISRIDGTITSRMATYTQPTGFLSATFPTGTVANTTNITSITGNITGNLTGSVGSVTGLTASNLDVAVSTVATSVLTGTMTEAYPTKGAAFTLAQGIYAINQQLGEQSIAGTTMTVKKRNQSTTAKTYTLDSAVTPTSITEAT
jgi:hypothetical protein